MGSFQQTPEKSALSLSCGLIFISSSPLFISSSTPPSARRHTSVHLTLSSRSAMMLSSSSSSSSTRLPSETPPPSDGGIGDGDANDNEGSVSAAPSLFSSSFLSASPSISSSPTSSSSSLVFLSSSSTSLSETGEALSLSRSRSFSGVSPAWKKPSMRRAPLLKCCVMWSSQWASTSVMWLLLLWLAAITTTTSPCVSWQPPLPLPASTVRCPRCSSSSGEARCVSAGSDGWGKVLLLLLLLPGGLCWYWWWWSPTNGETNAMVSVAIGQRPREQRPLPSGLGSVRWGLGPGSSSSSSETRRAGWAGSEGLPPELLKRCPSGEGLMMQSVVSTATGARKRQGTAGIRSGSPANGSAERGVEERAGRMKEEVSASRGSVQQHGTVQLALDAGVARAARVHERVHGHEDEALRSSRTWTGSSLTEDRHSTEETATSGGGGGGGGGGVGGGERGSEAEEVPAKCSGSGGDGYKIMNLAQSRAPRAPYCWGMYLPGGHDSSWGSLPHLPPAADANSSEGEMGCRLPKLRRAEERQSPGKIYSTLRRPQVETKVGVAYTYHFLDFLLGKEDGVTITDPALQY
ncbi:LOW QUALITY PROTEIN: hypothetical protein CRUP_013008 [Coryphaenoides rupestris]|nr:LOW QUALITY PROTEIN: hypothetical protein CRUP_013008 [Coryphaenoides rupestris]